jgi:hypothetical protein
MYASTASRAIGALLVERGVDVNVRNRFGAVPLTESTMGRNLANIELLCKVLSVFSELDPRMFPECSLNGP